MDYSKIISQNLNYDIKIICLNENSNIELNDKFILQYSGYGFNKRGAPFWLLDKVKSAYIRGIGFGVIFHEISATSYPWRSAFWVGPVQKHIAKNLANMSKFWIANRNESAKWLNENSRNRNGMTLPVFSNVGEMKKLNTEKCNFGIIFGGKDLRRKLYKQYGDDMKKIADLLGISLVDVGPAIDDIDVLNFMKKNNISQTGMIDSVDVGALLRKASYGFIAYSTEYLAKSGVFAAFCSHGLCSVVFDVKDLGGDGLVTGVNYIYYKYIKDATEVDVGVNSWNWYKKHEIIKHIDCYNEMIDRKL